MARAAIKGLTFDERTQEYRVRRMVRGVTQEVRTKDYQEALNAHRSMYATNARAVKVDRRVTVGTFVRRYIETTDSWTEGTRRTMRSLYRIHLSQRPFVDLALVKVNDEDVRAVLDAIAATPSERTHRALSAQTISQVRKLISGAFRVAVERGQMSSNVATARRGSSRPTKEIHPPTPDQMARIRAAVEGDLFAPLYVIAMHTGIREGELLGLRWSDVSLDDERPTIRIRGKLDAHTQIRHAYLKTSRSRRDLRLSPPAVAAFRERRATQNKHRMAAGAGWKDQDGLVATMDDGRPVNARTLVRHLQRVAARLGIQDEREREDVTALLRWHDFRHAWATLLLAQGMDLALVSKLLGHASYVTTANIYGHVTPSMRDDAADRIHAALG